ncbi:MAG TPA: hypothetical protein VF909_05815, partial [Roseiflexaceae bacterium]
VERIGVIEARHALVDRAREAAAPHKVSISDCRLQIADYQEASLQSAITFGVASPRFFHQTPTASAPEDRG